MTPQEAADRLGRAIEAAVEARHHALRAGADAIQAACTDAIGRDGGPDGTWPGLAEATLTGKAAAGQLGRISPQDQLYATGTLRGSYQVDDSDPDRIRVGSTDPVAVWHEMGTASMPPRPVLTPIAHQQAEAIARQVGEDVARAIRTELGQ